MATAKKTTKTKTTKTKTTKKKAPAKKKVAAKKPSKTELVDDDGFAAVKGALFWKYKAISAEWSEGEMLHNQLRASELNELARPVYAPLRKIQSQIQQGLIARQQRKIELEAVSTEVAELFGLPNLKDCAIDTNTGRIHILDSEGSNAPVTPRALKSAQKKLQPPANKRKTKT